MREFSHNEACMGTVFTFSGLTDNPNFDSALLSATNSLHKADAIFSLYKEHSPLSRLARGETSVAECPPIVDTVWNLCEEWEKRTDGWFSAFTPQHTFDPSGLVKTWAAQYAAEKLVAAGITDFTLNAGGDILIADGTSRDEFWRIAISKPVSIASPDAGVLTVLDLKGTQYRAVATSGSAERGQHIWNPKGGSLQSEVAQVSVIAKDLVEADVWATAAFAEGLRSIDRLNREPSIEALYVLANGELQGTDGIVGLFAKPKD
jgi:thiamine biosynthesis lipoprotein